MVILEEMKEGRNGANEVKRERKQKTDMLLSLGSNKRSSQFEVPLTELRLLCLV